MTIHNKTSVWAIIIGALGALGLITFLVLAIATIGQPELVWELVQQMTTGESE